MEKTKRTKRCDRFRRIKNKYEPVYRTPPLLKQVSGICSISESGIFQTDGGYYSKAYVLEEDKNAVSLKETEKSDADYGFLWGSDKKICYLICHTKKQDMTEAMEWFSAKEQNGNMKGMTAEERLSIYSRFFLRISGSIDETDNNAGLQDSYMQEFAAWKQNIKSECLKSTGGYLKTAVGIFRIVAVRRFPVYVDAADNAVKKLLLPEYVLAAYAEVSAVSNRAVSELIHSEYAGLDGVLPRLRRSNPPLHGILTGSALQENRYVRGSVYFLLHASDMEKMRGAEEEFARLAKNNRMQTDPVPLGSPRILPEERKMLAMFGLSGFWADRYESLLPADHMYVILQGENIKAEEKEDYDVNEMRALFYEQEPKDRRNG